MFRFSVTHGQPDPITSESEFLACFQEATELLSHGNGAEARPLYERCLWAYPGHFDTRHLLGVTCMQLGDLPQAVAHLESSVSARPDYAPAWFNLGLALGQLSRHEDAIHAYSKAVEIEPTYAHAWNNRGNELKRIGRISSAIDSFKSAVAADPGYAEAHYNMGVAWLESKHFQEAFICFQSALHLQPRYEAALINAGIALFELGDFKGSLEKYDHALAVNADGYSAHYNRGLVLREVGRRSDSAESFRQSLSLNPVNAECWSALGVVHLELGGVVEALDCFEKAICIDPAYVKAYWNKAQALLLSGAFSDGWRFYEWRWRNDEFTSPIREFNQPLWLGDFEIKGQIILLHAEQGLGDTIQFCRYVAMVKSKGATVVLEVPPSMVRLLSCLGDVDRVIARHQELPDFDCHCPLMSLPLALGEPYPWSPARPYLSPEPARVALWSTKLPNKDGLRVGICWRGSAKSPVDRGRSFGLAEFRGICELGGVQLVSLYKGDGDTASLGETGVTRVEWPLRPFDDDGAFLDTAAIMVNCDLVISSDTAIAHLAGAMGLPVWLALQKTPEWRWLLERTDSPWYPTMRLFRQQRDGDWAGVFEEMAGELRLLLGPT